MRRSELRSVKGVFSGCFDAIRVRNNEGKKMQKQYFKTKKGENRGKKKSKIVEKAPTPENRVQQRKKI